MSKSDLLLLSSTCSLGSAFSLVWRQIDTFHVPPDMCWPRGTRCLSCELVGYLCFFANACSSLYFGRCLTSGQRVSFGKPSISKILWHWSVSNGGIALFSFGFCISSPANNARSLGSCAKQSSASMHPVDQTSTAGV